MPVSKKEISPCPIDAMLSVIDGRWKGTILWRLSEGSMRTSELRRSIPEITERMLIRHLQELVHDGILIRHQAHPARPESTTPFRPTEKRCSPCWKSSAPGAATTSSAARPAPPPHE